MATKRQVTLRFRDEYMKASKKDKGRILDEMCSVLAIGRSTARRRLAEARRGPVSFQPCAAFHLLHAQFCLSILIQTCSFAVFDGRFLFHRVPSPAGWLRRWLRGCHPPQA